MLVAEYSWPMPSIQLLPRLIKSNSYETLLNLELSHKYFFPLFGCLSLWPRGVRSQNNIFQQIHPYKQRFGYLRFWLLYFWIQEYWFCPIPIKYKALSGFRPLIHVTGSLMTQLVPLYNIKNPFLLLFWRFFWNINHIFSLESHSWSYLLSDITKFAHFEACFGGRISKCKVPIWCMNLP